MKKGIICNGYLIVPPQILNKDILNHGHDGVHCGDKATQRLILSNLWSKYSKEVEDYIMMPRIC